MLDVLSEIASVATALAVIVATWQLVLSRQQAVTNFEDSLNKEYRDISAILPVEALLGETLTDEEFSKNLDKFYRYFDLCNQQIYLNQRRRISKKTWKFWREGIESNLSRPAFEKTWAEVAYRSNGSFSELRGLFPPKLFPWPE